MRWPCLLMLWWSFAKYEERLLASTIFLLYRSTEYKQSATYMNNSCLAVVCPSIEYRCFVVKEFKSIPIYDIIKNTNVSLWTERDTCLFHPESYRYNKFSNLHIKYARDAAESFGEIEFSRISAKILMNIDILCARKTADAFSTQRLTND